VGDEAAADRGKAALLAGFFGDHSEICQTLDEAGISAPTAIQVHMHLAEHRQRRSVDWLCVGFAVWQLCVAIAHTQWCLEEHSPDSSRKEECHLEVTDKSRRHDFTAK